MPITIGIDPGKYGAIVALDYSGKIIKKPYRMPTRIVNGQGKAGVDHHGVALALADLIRGHESDVVRVVVEQVGSRPDQGRSSIYSFGKGTGILLGVAAGLGLDTVEVLPQTWQTVLGRHAHQGKDGVIQWAAEIWGRLALIPARCREPHDGVADALGLAEWCRRHLHPDRRIILPAAELADQHGHVPPPSPARRELRTRRAGRASPDDF